MNMETGTGTTVDSQAWEAMLSDYTKLSWHFKTPSWLARSMRDLGSAADNRAARSARGYKNRKDEKHGQATIAARSKALGIMGYTPDTLRALQDYVKDTGTQDVAAEVRRILLTQAYKAFKLGKLTVAQARLFGCRVRGGSK